MIKSLDSRPLLHKFFSMNFYFPMFDLYQCILSIQKVDGRIPQYKICMRTMEAQIGSTNSNTQICTFLTFRHACNYFFYFKEHGTTT